MKQIIPEILSYIQDHVFTSDLKVEDIAAHFAYDKHYFSREFKNITGYSLNEYISSLKSQQALNLIHEENRIIDLQSSAGYSSSGSFSNTFKKYTGSSPSQYKNEMYDIYYGVKDFEHSDLPAVHHIEQSGSSSCHVSVELPPGYKHALLFIGLFQTPIPNHRPMSGIATKHPQDNRLTEIPPGEYYLLACAVSSDDGLLSYFNLRHCLRGRVDEKLCFPACSGHSYVIKLRPPIPEDPPILVNLAKLLVSSAKKTTK